MAVSSEQSRVGVTPQLAPEPNDASPRSEFKAVYTMQVMNSLCKFSSYTMQVMNSLCEFSSYTMQVTK